MSADVEVSEYNADVSQDEYTADLDMEIIHHSLSETFCTKARLSKL